jgi:hypothetical protein
MFDGELEQFVGAVQIELRADVFARGQGFKRLLLGALADTRVGSGKICLRNLQIEHRLAFGLILGVDNLNRIVLVAGLQAGAFSSSGVHAIACAPSIAATNYAVTCCHDFSHATAKIDEADPEVLASTGRVNARFAKF